MKRHFIFLVVVMLLFALSISSWAQCPEDTIDLGVCDTLFVEPWPYVDTCFISCYMGNCDTICINDPGEKFPAFMYVNLFVTHDSNYFYYIVDNQDSIRSFVIPLTFWHQSTGGTDSLIFPFGGEGYQGINNPDMNQYLPWMEKSMFRHFVDRQADDTTYNRMLKMVEAGKAAWTVYTDIDSVAAPGDSGYVFLSMPILAATCQAWWEGDRTLLATLTFRVPDTMCICIDTTLWVPNPGVENHLSFSRIDAELYVPRHLLPLGIKINSDGSVDTCQCPPTDVRWIEGSTEDEENRPTSFSVSQNYPNPFNPATNIEVSLPHASHVKIEVFNILGQKVKTLVDKDMRAGVYLVDWDGMDERGVRAPSGVYFYRIVAGEFSDIRKMVLLK